MKYVVKTDDIKQSRTGCLVVGIFTEKNYTDSAKKLNGACDKIIDKLARQGDFSGKKGQTLVIHNLAQQFPSIAAQRILLVGLGDKENFNEAAFEEALTAAFRQLKGTGAKDALCTLSEAPLGGRDLFWKIRQKIILCEDNNYQFNECKSGNDKGKISLQHIHILVADSKKSTLAKQAIKEGQAIADGMALCKTLGNRPGNLCTPTDLANEAKKIAKQFSKIKCNVLNEAAMEKLGMGSLLSVSRGSEQPAKLITLQYQGAAKTTEKPIALVGKGVTFDSGGISLKPGAAMDEMKYDMMGAASVLGAMLTAAKLKLPINVVGVIACTENLPSSRATKPGDIVKSMSGKTIEILNTDAEGRLILCDALTYCERFKPKQVIDVATLTGAIVVALGHCFTGVFSNDDGLQKALVKASEQSFDPAWPMPMDSSFDNELKSNFADMANIGGRWGGSSIAACFLARFTKKFSWAHLDIAGTAWNSGANKGATGRPVPLLSQYLINQSNLHGKN